MQPANASDEAATIASQRFIGAWYRLYERSVATPRRLIPSRDNGLSEPSRIACEGSALPLSYRPLRWFWGSVLWLTVAGGSVLQILGPPSRPAVRAVTLPSVALSTLPALPTAKDIRPRAVDSVPSLAEAPAGLGELALFPPEEPAEPATVAPRARTLVRRNARPSVVRNGEGDVVAERGPSAPFARVAPPPPALDATPGQRVAGYIGVYAPDADGRRAFRATP